MISLPNGSFYSKYQFAIFRIIFGIYLAIHFLGLIPYASELWSVDGSISDHRILPSFGFFPNILFWGTSAEFVTIFVLLLLLAALAFAAALASAADLDMPSGAQPIHRQPRLAFRWLATAFVRSDS